MPQPSSPHTPDTPPGRPLRKGTVLSVVSLTACVLLGGVARSADGTAPTIRLFPTTVIEEIRLTGQVAEQMESGLQGVIARLEEQEALYREARCEGAEGDPGCSSIARNLGATYLEMLNVMETQLPEMERAVNATRVGLEKRLRNELGHKLSPWALQDTLLGGDGSGKANTRERPAMRGKSGLRLSQRFRQYHQLVATSTGGADDSLAVVAADIYLDMQEASVLIAQTRQEIARATLLEQLNQSFGQITPEMQQVVGGVKAILFGEQDAEPIPGPRPSGDDAPWRSPLEM
ncbi:MAG: hypothetical protein AAGA68_18600 [Pseudomonadota bacterium]